MPQATVYGPAHPDKACDLISAAVIEEYEKRDPSAKLNLRVSGGNGALFLAGEAKSQADFDVSSAVKRACSLIDPALSLEPFIAIEEGAGFRDPVSVFGYATNETESLLPPAVEQASRIARELEQARRGHEDWFWLFGDYDVTVTYRGNERLACIRVGHLEQSSIEQVRQKVSDAVSRVFEGGVRVNPNGADTRQGLAKRIGASGRLWQEWYGAALPANPPGVGHETNHPSNLGRWYARAAARELVLAEKGKAVFVQMQWLPLESKPRFIFARNERGDRLGQLLEPERFDLKSPPENWKSSELLSMECKSLFDGAAEIPWENARLSSI